MSTVLILFPRQVQLQGFFDSSFYSLLVYHLIDASLIQITQLMVTTYGSFCSSSFSVFLTEESVEIIFELSLLKLGEPSSPPFVAHVPHLALLKKEAGVQFNRHLRDVPYPWLVYYRIFWFYSVSPPVLHFRIP